MNFIKISQILRDTDAGVLLATAGVRTGYTYKYEWDTEEDTVTLTSLNGGWSWSGYPSLLNIGTLYHDVDHIPAPIKGRPLLTSAYLRDVWREQALAYNLHDAKAAVLELKHQAAEGLFTV